MGKFSAICFLICIVTFYLHKKQEMFSSNLETLSDVKIFAAA